MDYYAHPLLEKVMKEPDNNTCIDCGAGHPNWASINNGVVLCLNCAGVHRGFGVQVSIIRSLSMDNWDDNQINFLKLGGNNRFKELMKEYKVPDNAGPEFKYLISAANYYRKLLRSEVTGEAAPEKPDHINGLELLDFGNNNYTNITNFQPITSESVSSSGNNKEGGLFGKIGGFFSDTSKSLVKAVKDANIKEKLSEVGDKAFDIAKKTGNFVAEKGKEAYQSPFVQNIAHKTEEGLNTLVDKAKKVFNKDEDHKSNTHYEPVRAAADEKENYDIKYSSEHHPIPSSQEASAGEPIKDEKPVEDVQADVTNPSLSSNNNNHI